jgi:hypothetical protein
MKKFIRLCTAFALTAVILGAGSVSPCDTLYTLVGTEVSAAGERAIIGSITYEVNDDGTTATVAHADPDETSGEVTIPATVEIDNKTYNVTTIDDYAFVTCTDVTAVNMPSVTKIGAQAFTYCSGLTKVVMPNVTEIGEYGFHSCEALASIDASNVATIGDDAFSGTALTSVNMPNLTAMGESAFENCTKLTSVDMPNVTAIPKDAFRRCESLTSVSVPKATSLGEYAFFECTSLTSVNISEVTSLGEYAFFECTSLTSVSIPKATSFGEYAFYFCDNLTSLDISSATEIGNAINSCDNLKYVYVSEDCTYQFNDGVTKRYSVADEYAQIVWDETNNDDFDVVINKDRFGGASDDAMYLEAVEILVDNEVATRLKYYVEGETDNTIIYHIKLDNKPKTDKEIKAQVLAYKWENNAITGDVIYYATSAKTINAVVAEKINATYNVLDTSQVNVLSFD